MPCWSEHNALFIRTLSSKEVADYLQGFELSEEN
jgi:hypothetical protein